VSYKDFAVATGDNYAYRVTAVNGVVPSAYSNTVTLAAPFVDITGKLGTTWTLPATGVAGEPLSGRVSVVVSNLGNVALPSGQQVTIQFIARNLTNPANPDVLLATLANQSVSALAANGALTFSTTVNLLAGLPASTYQILANIVPVQPLAESNLTNNLAMLTATGLSKTLVLF